MILLMISGGAFADECVNSPVELAWQPNAELDVWGYVVYRATNSGGPFTEHSGLVPSPSTSWTDTINLVEGQTYYYAISAVDITENYSELSSPSPGFTIDTIAPLAQSNPPGGIYPDSISVSLSANEPSTIYYTTNGSVPTTRSAIYSSPIQVTVSKTLRFFASDCADNQSAIMTSQYIIGDPVDIVTITSGPDGSPNPVASEGAVNCAVTAADSLGHGLEYSWNASGGSFNNNAIRNPIWTAPVNISGTTASYTIGVVVTCSGDETANDSYPQWVHSEEPPANDPPVADAGDDMIVAGSKLVELDGCSSYDPDDSPSDLTYAWSQTGGANSVSLTGADTCNPTFVSPGVGDTLTFRLTVGDGEDSSVDTVRVIVDAQAPILIMEDMGPYPNQGLDGGIGAEAFTCIRARLLDDMEVDTDSRECETGIIARANSQPISGRVVYDHAEPGLVWMMFVPDYEGAYPAGLPAGLQVDVTIRACDVAGNSMEPFQYSFKVQDPAPVLPAQAWSPDPNPGQDGDILTVELLEGELAGAKMEYLDTTLVEPYFGATLDLPEAPGGETTLTLNLQPTQVFADPVRIYIPLPGETDLGKYKIRRYDPNPESEWLAAAVGDGWLEYREDHDLTEPPMIEIWVSHFTGLALEDDASGKTYGGSSGSACFIATAAYGSPSEGSVLVFREFRDRHMLTNAPGRLFVRTYYSLSPPMANFIAEHDSLRYIVRLGLTPIASICKLVLISPQGSHAFAPVIFLILGLAAALTTAVRIRKRLMS
jgi:hypothetical protein